MASEWKWHDLRCVILKVTKSNIKEEYGKIQMSWSNFNASYSRMFLNESGGFKMVSEKWLSEYFYWYNCKVILSQGIIGYEFKSEC